MTYKQQDARIKRGTMHDVAVHTFDKDEYARKLMDKLANGEKMKPEGKAVKPSRRKPVDPYADYERGICSGCHKELLKAPDGRTFHKPKVSKDCPYASPEVHEEVDKRNFTVKVTSGTWTFTYSLFDFQLPYVLDELEMNVPEWCFFDLEFV